MFMNWQLLISFPVEHTQKAPEMSFWLGPYGIFYVKKPKKAACFLDNCHFYLKKIVLEVLTSLKHNNSSVIVLYITKL